ncbi:dispanin subfamily A member 2b-like [Aquarana catesbeiana]|uniref:dispanin subfamily A member 2b-like n=1 Tax=Aquarana catesbeiana TaxID=8400 RepID=UPI003CC9A31F
MEPRDYDPELNLPPRYSKTENGQQEMEFLNIPRQQIRSTVITISPAAPEDPPVKDHLILSLFNAIYMNCFCLGFLALVFSIKSQDRKQQGDRHGAQSYGTTARSLNIAALVLSFLFFAIVIFFSLLRSAKIFAMLHNDRVNQIYG